MSFKIVLIILIVLIALCSLLITTVISIKLIQLNRERKRNIDTKNITPILNRLLADEKNTLPGDYKKDISKLADKLKDKISLQTLENMLLDILENAEGETETRALAIAKHFKFPENCILMIRSRLSGNIAIGCRKAGLYKFSNAIPDIQKVLDILSSSIQLEALMALSRIGDTIALVQAFDKIHRLIFVNERAINEIIRAFTGEQLELYKKMIFHKSDYLVRLFLKAIDKGTANKLIDDIILISQGGDKETRLACIIAIGRSGNREKVPALIQAMSDKEWEIRAMAVKTLSVLTSPKAVMHIKKAACDREWWVRQNAVTTILEYPDYEKNLISIVKKGDRFAYENILYTLQKTDKSEILPVITEAWAKQAAGRERAGKRRKVSELSGKKSGNKNILEVQVQ